MFDYPTGTYGNIRRRVIERQSEDEILDEIANMFPEAENFKKNSLKNEISSTINKALEKEEFIYKIVKGDFNNIPAIKHLKEYLSDPNIKLTLNHEEEKQFYKKIHQYIFTKISIVKCMDYIDHTFPLWTNLKKLLLDERAGTNKKQWEYIAENTSISQDIINNVKNAKNYKELSDFDTKDLVSFLVNHIIPNATFQNVIEQKGNDRCWFPNGINKPPKQTNVTNPVLYKLAFSFNLSENDIYSKLCKGSENYTSNPFDYEAVMFRFGLKYQIPYIECKERINKIEEYIKSLPTDEGKKVISNHYPLNDAIEGVKKYFDQNINKENIDQIAGELTNFLCQISKSDSLEEKRKDIAAELMNKIIEKTNVKKIQEYYSLTFTLTFKDISDILYEKYSEDIADKYEGILLKQKEKLLRLNEDEKIKALHLICDGKNVDKHRHRNSLKYSPNNLGKRAFTAKRIEKIISKEIDEINRSDILRMGYLNTLIEYINGCITDQNIITYFETTVNKVLNECLFHPLYSALPLDALMYLSLSSENKCKPEVYQAFIEREIKKR